MGFFDFLFPTAEYFLPIALIIQAILTVAFIVLAIIIIKWLPKGKVAGLIVCIIAIIVVWIFL